ncbi:MAG: cytochrome d ubiquinol oxidase subunit II [Chloroflexi bacterium]|nr:MAG: cytochrome d ubiquinol oxidase subunit II [Chloroflexota bacterium]
MTEAVVVILWLSLSAYAVLAGADFGGGVWDALAWGPRAHRQRRAVAFAMGPVWEANHVWLIFLIVGLFTAFPPAFAALAVALYLPFTAAMTGIVLRGAAFAFRAHGREAVGRLQPWGVVFGAASVLTPAFLGAAAAAVASGAIRVSGGRVTSGPFDGWTTPLALDFALLAVSICAYLAATYLMVETQDEPDLQADFRRRAVGAGLASGAFALLGLVIAWFTARPLVDELLGRGLPLLALALLNGPVALVAVLRGHPRVARRAVIGQIVLVLWAWGVGQYPALVPPDLTVRGTAAPDATISLMLVVVAAGMAVLLPSLYLLFRVFKGRAPV